MVLDDLANLKQNMSRGHERITASTSDLPVAGKEVFEEEDPCYVDIVEFVEELQSPDASDVQPLAREREKKKKKKSS